MTEILPDSRTKARKGAKWSRLGYWVPVFCAECGVPYGYVPEENCTFACWLCDKCAETHGAIYGMALMPDEVFWDRVRQEQLDRYGRLLDDSELIQIADDNSTPLAKLLNQGNN